MKSKRIAAILLSGALSISMLAGCGNDGEKESSGQEQSGSGEETSRQSEEPSESTEESEGAGESEESQESQEAPTDADPMERITQGRYFYGYNAGGDLDMSYFFHFYEEQPVLGKVFYAGFAINQIYFHGTYEVTEEPYEYACWPGREERASAAEDAEAPTGTAPYTITFYDFDGNELDKCGFDGENVYNDMVNITGVGGEDAIYRYDDPEGENKDVYDGEVGYAVVEIEGVDDATCQLRLWHTGRYQDLVDMEIEGTWTMEQGADATTYTLTPDDDTDTGAVVVVNNDGTAVYTPDGGDAVEMKQAGASMTSSFAGDGPEVSGAVTSVVLEMYSDGTAKVNISAFGTVMPLDEGTWEAENEYTFKFSLGTAGELTSELGEEGLPTVHYVQAGSQVGDLDVVLTYVMPEAE